MRKVIGIDIGGTKVRAAVVNESGHVLEEELIPTEAQSGGKALLQRLEVLVRILLQRSGGVDAIGIGAAGRIDTASNRVVYATDNLPGWQGISLGEWAVSRFGLQAAADNDANTALIGEAWIGAGRDFRDLVMLTLGTGVGGAVMSGGMILQGARFRSGDFGHAVLVPGGRPCNCGRRGCAEQYLSGRALVRLGQEKTGRAYTDGRELISDAEAGSALAISALEEYTGLLALLVGNVEALLDPEAVIIGGGVADSGHLWLPNLTEKCKTEGAEVPVRLAQLGNRAGCLGAAKLAFEQLVCRPVI